MTSRQDTRFNSMLQEFYGGRKAIRHFLQTGKLKDIRLPPVDRLSVADGQRRPVPAARPRRKVRHSGKPQPQLSQPQPQQQPQPQSQPQTQPHHNHNHKQHPHPQSQPQPHTRWQFPDECKARFPSMPTIRFRSAPIPPSTVMVRANLARGSGESRWVTRAFNTIRNLLAVIGLLWVCYLIREFCDSAQ